MSLYFNCLLLILIIPFLSLVGTEPPKRWVVNYSDKVTFDELDVYSVIVLDSHEHPPLDGLIEQNKDVYGYLSLVEVNEHRPYFASVKAKGLFLEENKNWPGSYMVDIRDKKWVEMVLEEIIPSILFQRFRGLFFDTIDNAIYLEDKDPIKYKGMKEAAIKLIKGIKFHYPEVSIMLNRGYEILPQVAADIKIALAESIYTTYDFSGKTYQKVSDEEYQYQLKLLEAAKKVNPKLEIFTLDYWDPSEADMIREIYSLQRKNGFIPYVSTIELDRIVLEPVQ